MSADHSYRPFPRGSLIICGSAVFMALALAAIGTLTGAANNPPTGQLVASRDLVFQDREDGAVEVYDARDKAQPIEVVAPGTGYFLRATMRGLARQRVRLDESHDTPFHLTAWNDGRLILEDPTTGRHVDMEAFGHTNEDVFAALLTAKAGS